MEKVIHVEDFVGNNLSYATVWVSRTRDICKDFIHKGSSENNSCVNEIEIIRDHRKINKIQIYCKVDSKKFCEIVKDKVEDYIKLGILRNPVNIGGEIEKVLEKLFEFLAWKKIGFADCRKCIGNEPTITSHMIDKNVLMRSFLYETIEEDYQKEVDRLCQENKEAFYKELFRYSFDFWDEFIVEMIGDGFQKRFGMFRRDDLKDFIESHPDCKDAMINAFMDGKYYPLNRQGEIKSGTDYCTGDPYNKGVPCEKKYSE